MQRNVLKCGKTWIHSWDIHVCRLPWGRKRLLSGQLSCYPSVKAINQCNKWMLFSFRVTLEDLFKFKETMANGFWPESSPGESDVQNQIFRGYDNHKLMLRLVNNWDLSVHRFVPGLRSLKTGLSILSIELNRTSLSHSPIELHAVDKLLWLLMLLPIHRFKI